MGWLHLGHSAPSTGGAWNETGARRERRHLKHRATEEVRPVPISPALAKLLRDHLAEYDTAPDGRLFRGEGGDLLSDTVCTRTWEKARQAAVTPAEAASPLAERPYDLRHARLSTWLNAGVAPAQVAEWAGNSVPVLLRVTPNVSPTPSRPPSTASRKLNYGWAMISRLSKPDSPQYNRLEVQPPAPKLSTRASRIRHLGLIPPHVWRAGCARYLPQKRTCPIAGKGGRVWTSRLP